MDSLHTYFISYYNACKWLLIALEWDLSITADRFDPSIGVLLLLLVLSLVAASAIATCLVSPKSSSSSNISLKLINYYIFLNVS